MKQLTQINNWYFVRRLCYLAILLAGGYASIIYGNLLFEILGIFIVGSLYAHAIELQHQALHHTAFTSKFWNRFAGVILGIPILVSYTDYQVHHWRHHRDLGTSANKEFFNYSYDKLRSVTFMLPHLFMVYHYRDVVKFMALSLRNKIKEDVSEQEGTKIKYEYLIMLATITIVVALSVYFKSTLAVYLWFLPLLVGIPMHALIELPEHLGCPQLSINPFHNTRTIKSTWLGVWFTNANNYHVEHHFLPGVPNDKAAELHRVLEPRIKVLDNSFISFYALFIKKLIKKEEF
jgi:fatty acid desaturase